MPLKIFSLDPVTVTVANDRYAISNSRIYAASITLQADYNNVGRIAVGGDTVTASNGTLIGQGESAVIEFPANTSNKDEFDLSLIYVTSSNSGDIVRISYIKRV